MSLRPFFTFYGGKWRAAPHYPAPRFGTIVEPFAGSAGYSLRYADRDVVLVERDPLVAETWRYLLHVNPDEVLNLPDLAPGQSVDDLDVSEGARLLIGWWLNKGTASPCKRPGAWMRGGLRPNSLWGPAVRLRIAEQVPKIRHWTLIEGDYTHAPDVPATWFVDPPYRIAGKHYRCGSERLDCASLGEWCCSRKGQVMVCENEGADWMPFRPFRAIKASEARHGGKVSREAVWTNDPWWMPDP